MKNSDTHIIVELVGSKWRQVAGPMPEIAAVAYLETKSRFMPGRTLAIAKKPEHYTVAQKLAQKLAQVRGHGQCMIDAGEVHD